MSGTRGQDQLQFCCRVWRCDPRAARAADWIGAGGGAGESDRSQLAQTCYSPRPVLTLCARAILVLRSNISVSAGKLIVFLESINRNWIDRLNSAYAPHALLRDSEAMLLLTGTLIGICTSAPVKAAAAAAASPSPSTSPSVEVGTGGGGAFTIGDARVRLMQAEAAKVRSSFVMCGMPRRPGLFLCDWVFDCVCC